MSVWSLGRGSPHPLRGSRVGERMGMFDVGTATSSITTASRHWSSSPHRDARKFVRLVGNVAGALVAALFARRYLLLYLSSHRLIGVAFFVQQMWIMTAFLARRTPLTVSRRTRDWLLAYGGTFGGVLLQPSPAHFHWGSDAGLAVQFIGLAISIASLVVLGRSFGSVAANRGIVHRGPYAVVRHPLYAGYFFIQIGYVLYSLSWWNVFVVLFVTTCNVGRAVVEERLLALTGEYGEYQREVRWRLLPRIW
jgi:protein-S-isoprenylcysteine O-methyltransferase Ste14